MNMKKNKILPLLLLVCLLASMLIPAAFAVPGEEPTESAVAEDSYAGAGLVEAPTLTANAALLVDMDSDVVYFSRHAEETAYPASLTKIMTVLLAVEAIERGDVSLKDEVTAQSDCLAGLDEESSTASIVPGEVMTLENYLYCAMVSSANEACNVIGSYLSGSISAFVELMNERAEQLGCTGTHYVNTHGMPDDNHYTTAMDLYRITAEAMQHELFATLCNTVTRTVPATNKHDTRELQNTNGLINSDSPVYPGYFYDYAFGVKTGHTSAAGYCLVSTAQKDGIRLLCVVLGSDAKTRANGTTEFCSFTDTLALYNWLYGNFSRRDIVSDTELICDVPVELGSDADSVTVRAQNSIAAVLPNSDDLAAYTRSVVIYSERDGTALRAPVAAGDVLGEITVEKDGVVYGSAPLVAAVEVELSHGAFLRSGLRAFFGHPVVIAILLVIALVIAAYIVLLVRYNRRRKARRHAMQNAQHNTALRRERQAQNAVLDEFRAEEEATAGRRPDQ